MPPTCFVARAIAVGALLGGCTVIAPDLHLSPIIVPAAPHTAQSLAPWPSPEPSPTPSVARPAPRAFSGNGPAQRLGPVTLLPGHARLHVSFKSTIALSGDFQLMLLDGEGHFMANLVNESGGSFDRTYSPAIELPLDYFLEVTAADGAWALDINPSG